MQTAREGIRSTRAFFEFTARMKLSEDDFYYRELFSWVHSDRNTAAIILHAHTAIGVQSHNDLLAKSA